MPELYPSDSTLLALTEDPITGVEYIPTGRSPYFLEFRRLIERMLLVSKRTNDLRLYQEGDLSVGIRAVRCFVNNITIEFTGTTGISVASNVSTYFWIDFAGTPQSSTSALLLQGQDLLSHRIRIHQNQTMLQSHRDVPR